MLRVQPITSLELPELEPYRTMRRPLDHRERGIFVAEGEKIVRRLIESRFEIVSVLMSENWLREFRPMLEARSEEIHAFVAEKNLLEQLTGFPMYQGALALGRIPGMASLEEVVRHSLAPRFFVAVDGLTNAENLGALVRNCGGFGVQALLVGRTSSSPFLRRAVRNSMGVVFKLPIVEDLDLPEALQTLRALGVRSLAAHPNAGRGTLAQASLAEDCCVVFGSEGYGISPAVLDACDQAASIPMAGGVDSLNVASASAVFLYEVARQRGRG
jgi:tRNA G18 (ribose-2'-O)-methylase SpoU